MYKAILAHLYNAAVDARGSQVFICKRASGRIARHQPLNDVVSREFVSAGVPVTKEPVGLARQDGKRLGSLTLIPWQAAGQTLDMGRHSQRLYDEIVDRVVSRSVDICVITIIVVNIMTFVNNNNNCNGSRLTSAVSHRIFA